MRAIDLPLLIQEMRIRQRGIRPFTVMALYVAVLSVIALITLYISGSTTNISQSSMSDLGRSIFTYLSIAQLAMISLIVPAYSASSVSAERERHAFELLALTLIPSASIVTQKLGAALLQAMLLLVASIPVISIVFFFGGVSPFEVILVYVVLLLSAVMYGTFGMLCSCCFGNTRSSTFAAYLGVMGFVVGLPIIGSILQSIFFTSRSRGDNSFFVTMTGGFAFGCAVIALVVYACIVSPIAKRVTERWKVRAFRMGIFGAVFAVVTLTLSNSLVTDAVVSTLYYQNIFLPLFVNPFMAVTTFLSSSSFYSRSASYYIASTIAFAITCGYFFRHLSIVKFHALRRSQ